MDRRKKLLGLYVIKNKNKNKLKKEILKLNISIDNRKRKNKILLKKRLRIRFAIMQEYQKLLQLGLSFKKTLERTLWKKVCYSLNTHEF